MSQDLPWDHGLSKTKPMAPTSRPGEHAQTSRWNGLPGPRAHAGACRYHRPSPTSHLCFPTAGWALGCERSSKSYRATHPRCHESSSQAFHFRSPRLRKTRARLPNHKAPQQSRINVRNQSMQSICIINPGFLCQNGDLGSPIKTGSTTPCKKYNKPNMYKTQATRNTDIFHHL